ncbi:hypothetical protein QBC44DRAFT_387621 [Cladorrhinum sp. PSN332]|nr:hypothetical protein QBC44DRAFT_387621 [Cladorrhinum sp. PSN332]
MEYQYSNPVDTTNYNDEGFASGIPVRIHKQAHLADLGALRAQEDWKREVRPLPIGFAGTVCPSAPNATALMGAEILPDRLETTAYGIELSFLIDDMIDQGESSESPSGILKGLTDEIAIATIKWLASLYDPVAKAMGRTNLPGLDAYLKRRIVSVGSSLGFGIMLFAMDMAIPDGQ